MNQRSKTEIVEDIKNSFGNSNLVLLSELLLRIISDARVRNDTARGDDVILNQGEVRCCDDIAIHLFAKEYYIDNFTK